MTDTLRISDVLSREVDVEWFEAVALVREVADRVRDSLAGQAVPELHQIALDIDGRVTLLGAGLSDEPVRRMGQLLLALLVQSEPPVQLRLLGSQAVAPAPAFGSIREFAEALDYFERPDREAVLRGLFVRAAAVPDRSSGPAPTLDVIAPLSQEPEQPKEQTASPGRRRARALPAFAAAIVLVVGGAAYWQLRGAAAPSSTEVADLAVKASDAVGTALVSGLSSVTDTVGLGRLAPADGSEAPAPAGDTAAKTTPSMGSPVQTTLTQPRVRLFDLPPKATAGLPVIAPPLAPVPAPATGKVIAVDLSDTNVYSAADPEVVAPIGVRPQLPAVLPGDISRDSLSQLELLVLPDGTVGAVKLLGPPRSVLEGMLLSAAKAWKFKPAMKGDRAVAYRKLVWLVLE